MRYAEMKDASLLCQVSCHASHTDVQHPFCVLIHAVEFGTRLNWHLLIFLCYFYKRSLFS